MTVVGLACLSAFMFGAMTVTLRIGLRRDPDVELATVATLVTALVVVLGAGAVEAPSRGVHGGAAWPFLLAGFLSPGAAQLFVTLGIREAGASRTSMVFGTAPLVSVTIALVFLGEPLSAPLLGGTLLVAVAIGPRLGGRRLSDARWFVPAGLCFGASYVALFEAYFRGRVTIVSPLVATESLWAVVLSVLLLRDSEVVGRRLALGAVLIVAGGVLIGTFR